MAVLVLNWLITFDEKILNKIKLIKFINCPRFLPFFAILCFIMISRCGLRRHNFSIFSLAVNFPRFLPFFAILRFIKLIAAWFLTGINFCIH
jgi:hypothetical protein